MLGLGFVALRLAAFGTDYAAAARCGFYCDQSCGSLEIAEINLSRLARGNVPDISINAR